MMTKEGLDWISSLEFSKKGLDIPNSACEPIAVEFWIRAFCDEVDRRAIARGGDNYTFDEVKLELLGEQDGL